MGNMKTHELLHSGVKPFTCGIDGCDRSFSQLGNLKVVIVVRFSFHGQLARG